ncbi:hypothetical protein K1719_023485 [Acacia pycnantha]|nr:hypothetical protein K1719_023485 [Acacia pycnantha]
MLGFSEKSIGDHNEEAGCVDWTFSLFPKNFFISTTASSRVVLMLVAALLVRWTMAQQSPASSPAKMPMTAPRKVMNPVAMAAMPSASSPMASHVESGFAVLNRFSITGSSTVMIVTTALLV